MRWWEEACDAIRVVLDDVDDVIVYLASEWAGVSELAACIRASLVEEVADSDFDFLVACGEATPRIDAQNLVLLREVE